MHCKTLILRHKMDQYRENGNFDCMLYRSVSLRDVKSMLVYPVGIHINCEALLVEKFLIKLLLFSQAYATTVYFVCASTIVIFSVRTVEPVIGNSHARWKNRFRRLDNLASRPGRTAINQLQIYTVHRLEIHAAYFLFNRIKLRWYFPCVRSPHLSG